MQTEYFRNADEMIRANGAAEAARAEAMRQILEGGADRLDKAVEEARTAREDLEKNITGAVSGSAQHTEEVVREELSENRKALLKQLEDSDRLAHKDAVRVYKNVQASMIEELQKQTAELKAELESVRSDLAAAVKKTSALEEERIGSRVMRPVKFLVGVSVVILVLELLNMSGVIGIFQDYLHILSLGI